MKRCSKCGEEKVLDEFHKKLTGSQGRQAYCKACRKETNAISNPITNATYRKQGNGAYGSWVNMKDRCTNPNATAYPWYGERGITFCREWETFEGFLADMGPRPEGHSISRIDHDGNYEPSNCEWAPHGSH